MGEIRRYTRREEPDGRNTKRPYNLCIAGMENDAHHRPCPMERFSRGIQWMDSGHIQGGKQNSIEDASTPFDNPRSMDQDSYRCIIREGII